MLAMEPFLSWPLYGHAKVTLAGRYLFAERDFPLEYDKDFHGFHLHGYAGRVRVGPHLFQVRQGDFTLSPKGMSAAFDVSQPGYHYCILFENPSASAASTTQIPMHGSFTSAEDYEHAVRTCCRILSLFATPVATSVHEALLSTGLQELLLFAATRGDACDFGRRFARSEHIVQVCAEWLRHHMEEPLEIECLCDRWGISKKYLSQRFRHHFGLTLSQYLLNIRMQEARKLLTTTTLPVKCIAAAVGICDSQYFNKQFRAVFGVSPSALRSDSNRVGAAAGMT